MNSTYFFSPARSHYDGKGSAAKHVTSERIAADLDAFREAGGRIEVLGNTPLRKKGAAGGAAEGDAGPRGAA
ncbi:hypothetical protein [Vulcaniibacterium tengchongense]|uniref:Uncharacterized protein n=1 Tax=Vulcaniibacterium tengchongense TaxID=1273429 RepID=A0A3N4VDU7_9GAMM|nr:hypothetical protein [Vulcaniibacterium tengchongense]RPE79665.1 hypothetical protein EDC50_1488 [Vulcaniibacterium tengchongense]